MQVRADPTPKNTPRDSKVPSHVAIIMDGNGRWARKQGMPRLAGHRVGADCIQKVLECLSSKGVRFVTLFAFSTENWNRPEEEVQGILEVLYDALRKQAQALHEAGVRVVHIGKMERLSPQLQQEVLRVQEQTAGNTGITLNVAFDYGGRDEILDAVRRVVRDGIPAEELTEERFNSYLYTAHCPDPDLILRTGGEMRISNFLLWQSAYSEYYHTPTLWPDLDSAELERVLEDFGNRERRFGRVKSGA